jgi:hypothetical protein
MKRNLRSFAYWLAAIAFISVLFLPNIFFSNFTSAARLS